MRLRRSPPGCATSGPACTSSPASPGTARAPFGATTSYGAIAKRLGQPGAARAVGAANGANPIALIVPCHRVIGADGSLTGYAGGLALKRKLLQHEARVCGTPLDLFS